MNILQYFQHVRLHNEATNMESAIESSTEIHIPHKILRNSDLASRQPKKSKQTLSYLDTHTHTHTHTHTPSLPVRLSCHILVTIRV